MNTEATHFSGSHIDQVWLRDSGEKSDVQVYSPYYTSKDHDALLISLYKPSEGTGIRQRYQTQQGRTVQRTKKGRN